MSTFSLEDLKAYEAQPQTDVENHDPWAKTETDPQVKAEADSESSTEAVTEPTENGTDGSTTENTAEPVAAEDANPEGENKPETEADVEDGKPRGRAQERIEELVAERNALRKYGEYLLNQVENMRTSPTQATQAPNQPAASQAQEKEEAFPTLEDAEFDSTKLANMQKAWFDKQVDKRVNTAVKQIETRQSESQIRQAFASRTEEFKKTAPDFDLVIANPALPALAGEAARVVIRSENGPAIAYHLAKNPDLAARISRLDVAGQAAAIGRIEGELMRTAAEASTPKEPSKKEPSKAAPAKVTKAPPPPKPLQGNGTPAPREPITMDEFVAQERARKIAERKQKADARKAFGR